MTGAAKAASTKDPSESRHLSGGPDFVRKSSGSLQDFVSTVYHDPQRYARVIFSAALRILSIFVILMMLPLSHSGSRGEVNRVSDIFSGFFLSVGASVVAHYICKWLDRRG